MCLKVCPGHEVDFKAMNKFISGVENPDTIIGHYNECYVGYSTNEKIRYNSSSGGLVTHFFLSALEYGLIDGALVTRMKHDNPLRPEPFIARSRDETLDAMGSKYCPVPANIALKEILKIPGKIWSCRLPCHIHGTRKAEMIKPLLAKRIVLHLGLVCNHTPTFKALEYLLECHGIKK